MAIFDVTGRHHSHSEARQGQEQTDPCRQDKSILGRSGINYLNDLHHQGVDGLPVSSAVSAEYTAT